MSVPKNISTPENPVGRFMVAIGAVIEHEETGLILLVKRSEDLNYAPGDWEIHYGRIDQHECPKDGLKREIKEETELEDIKVIRLLHAKHIYRGEKSTHNDMIVLTYHCCTKTREVVLSSEHSAYEWVSAEEAVARVPVEDVKDDIQAYIDSRNVLKHLNHIHKIQDGSHPEYR